MKLLPDITGRFVRLKPIAIEEAEFLFALRNNAELTRYINDGPATMEHQLRWMRSYFERDNDHNFVVIGQSTNERIGTVALYDIDMATGVAEPGRWLVRGDSRAALEADLLIHQHAFDTVGISVAHFTVCTLNIKTVSYHLKCGAKILDTVQQYFAKGDVWYSSHILELDANTFVNRKKPILRRLLYGEAFEPTT